MLAFDEVGKFISAFSEPLSSDLKREESSVRIACPIKFKADQHIINCSSLHELEYTSQGEPFRWTGNSNRVTFWVRLSAKIKWRVSFSFLFTEDESNKDGIVFNVNGVAIQSHQSQENSQFWLRSRSFISASHGETELQFIIAGTASPTTKDPSSLDTRILGVAWQTLTLDPE